MRVDRNVVTPKTWIDRNKRIIVQERGKRNGQAAEVRWAVQGKGGGGLADRREDECGVVSRAWSYFADAGQLEETVSGQPCWLLRLSVLYFDGNRINGDL